MRYVGSCPHCGARLEIAPPPPPLVTCGSCAGRGMPVLPVGEADASVGELRIDVLPWKEKGPRDSWLERWGLRRPFLFGLLAACALAVAFLLVGLLHLFVPETSLADGATMVFSVAAVLLVVVLPSLTVLSAIVVWILFGREGRRVGADFGRSVLAVTTGVVTLAVAGFLAFSLRSTLLLVLDVPAALEWTLSIASDVIACVCAGWVTVRFSPSAPFRHALGVGLVLGVGVLLLVLASIRSGSPFFSAPLASALYLLLLPVLLLGAWIGVRRPPALPR